MLFCDTEMLFDIHWVHMVQTKIIFHGSDDFSKNYNFKVVTNLMLSCLFAFIFCSLNNIAVVY